MRRHAYLAFTSRASAVVVDLNPKPASEDVGVTNSAQERLLTEAFRDMYSILAVLRSPNFSELWGLWRFAEFRGLSTS